MISNFYFNKLMLMCDLKKLMRYLFVVYVLCMAQSALCQGAANPPAADGAAKEYSDFYRLNERIDLTKKATIYIAPYNHWYLIVLTELRLKNVGCEYKTDDPVMISELVKIIKDGELKMVAHSMQKYEPREAIYLTLNDSSEVGLLFDREYANRSNLPGQTDGQSITADISLAEHLYRWVAKLAPVEKCESFVGRYR